METYDLHKKELKSVLSSLRASAKKRGIHFDITTSDLDEIGIPITCPVLGIPIYFNRDKASDNSISIDRIDSRKGYIRDNIIMVSHRANKLKSNATLEEMSRLVEFYKSLDQLANRND